MLYSGLKSILVSLLDYNLSNHAEQIKTEVLSEISTAISMATFDADRYTRQIIHQVKDFDVVLIGWSAGQRSPIHNHPTNGCLVYPIKGELLEERFCNELNPIAQTKIGVGDQSYIDNGICLHRLGNASDSESAISVHIYSPSDFVATIFKPDGQQEIIGTALP